MCSQPGISSLWQQIVTNRSQGVTQRLNHNRTYQNKDFPYLQQLLSLQYTVTLLPAAIFYNLVPSYIYSLWFQVNRDILVAFYSGV